jgi:hypothetical protein
MGSDAWSFKAKRRQSKILHSFDSAVCQRRLDGVSGFRLTVICKTIEEFFYL